MNKKILMIDKFFFNFLNNKMFYIYKYSNCFKFPIDSGIVPLKVLAHKSLLFI